MSSTITGHLIQDPHPTDESRIISVDPNARTGRFRFLQGAFDHVRSRASSDDPYTIKLLPGTYKLDKSIDAVGLTGVRIFGCGRRQTILRGTAAWVTAANAGATGISLLDMSSASDVVVSSMTIDAGVTEVGESGITLAQPLNALKNDLQQGTITLIDTHIRGLEYGTGSLIDGPAGTLFEVYNSRIEGRSAIARAGKETWHLFSCDLRATKTDNTVSQTSGCTVIQVGLGGSVQDWQLWGCHLHAEDSRTDPNGHIGGILIGTSTAALGVELLGCTIHVKTSGGGSPTGTVSIGGVVYNTTPQNMDIHLLGCTFLLETPAYSATTGALVGGVVSTANVNASNKLSLVGCDYIDRAGSGGKQRGAFVLQGSALTKNLPTLRVVGGNFPSASSSFGVAQTVVSSKDTGRITGSATLASGIARVALVTDAGNVEGAAAMSFTNANATVTGSGTTFLSTLKPGDFIRAATHLDDTWTRIKNIVSDTSLTLEEGYRGATLATTQGRRGTPSESTHWNGTNAAAATYKVSVTPTSVPSATDMFYTTAKHASGFVINSLDAASTAVVDWVLTR